MSDYVKIALTVGVTIVVLMGIGIYFSPFRQCVRSLDNNTQAEFYCAKAFGGN